MWASGCCLHCLEKGEQLCSELCLFLPRSSLKRKAQTMLIDCFAGTLNIYISDHQTKCWDLFSVQQSAFSLKWDVSISYVSLEPRLYGRTNILKCGCWIILPKLEFLCSVSFQVPISSQNRSILQPEKKNLIFLFIINVQKSNSWG